MHVPARVIRPQLHWVASSPLPTRHGEFTTHVFLDQAGDGTGTGKEHLALVFGDVDGAKGIPVRVHSECMTSEVFGSLKCDCKEQLDYAMAEVARVGRGAVVYLRQEGRGIGLTNKIRAYDLQARGHDTVDANRLLGLPDDARKYDIAADILEFLGVRSIHLLTNNPEKVEALRALGVEVVGRQPVIIAPNPYSAGYLDTKRRRMAHKLPRLSRVPQAGAGATPSLSLVDTLAVDESRPSAGDAE
ncbi:GTP cyclohydrolase II [Pendulispora brunnea]|uniref:GTP cyclohydrolase-2 n=1 Tax=Pendulispora brunnea TaxID=2905690 RepID=A0ABZ2K144_9BACT